MNTFPLFIDLNQKNCLILGGGQVALRKAEQLLSFGTYVHVISQEFVPEFESLNPASSPDTDSKAQDSRLILTEKRLTEANLKEMIGFRESYALVIAATDDMSLNRSAAQTASDSGIPVNVVDCPELCTFFFPALVTKGDLTVGISTAGASPAAASRIRKEIEKIVPEHFDRILAQLRAIRPQILREYADPSTRSRIFSSVLSEALAAGDALSEETIAAVIERASDKPAGFVTLVGAGCGNADLITVRGARAIGAADAIVYDDLIDPELLTLAKADAELIPMGKREGRHSYPQREIEEMLVSLASAGKNVVRLKGGDPYVFGRGGEECIALRSANIPYEVIPGISSAIAIPEEFGIPVTHRALSRSFHVITAHAAGTPDGLPSDFDVYAKLEGTLIFLMGLSRIRLITERLIASGKDPATPAAVLSGGNSRQSNAQNEPLRQSFEVRGTLADIADRTAAAGVLSPALIVIGETAGLDLRSPFFLNPLEVSQ